MTWWARYFGLKRGGERSRLQGLVAAGKTLDIGRLRPEDTVVRIDLGFGDEFWRVEPRYTVVPIECSIDGGQLIVEKGARVRDSATLGFLKKRIDHVVYCV